MPYVDGFVLPVPRKNMAAYRRMAKAAAKIWREHGALEFRECAGDDLSVNIGMPFARLTKAKRGETVMFSYIVYRSKADRNRVNKKVMKDPRMDKILQGKAMPFEVKRMSMGGFKVMVDA